MKKHLAIFLFLTFFFTGCVSLKKHKEAITAYNDSISVLKTELLSLKQDTSILRRDTSILRRDILKYIDSISGLEVDIVFHEGKIKRIEKERDEIKRMLENTSLDTAKLYKRIDSLRNRNSELEKIEERLTEQNLDLNKKIKELQKKLDSIIGSAIPNFLTVNEWSRKVSSSGKTFDVYVMDTKKNDLQFFWKDQGNLKYKSISSLKDDIERQGEKLKFATNGGMYKPDNSPQGLYVENGKTINPIDLSEGTGNFYMNFGEEKQSNGVFLIDNFNCAKVIKSKYYTDNHDKDTRFATQSGPLLLSEKKINSKFTKGSSNLHFRSGVGIINSNKIVFVISNQQVNLYDFASIFRDYFGCSDALYLDGAISQMYLPSINRNETGGNFGIIIGVVK